MMRRRRLILLASFVFLLGLHTSKIVNASANNGSSISQPFYVSDDEGIQQDVYNAGEDFYIWTTTESKIA